MFYGNGEIHVERGTPGLDAKHVCQQNVARCGAHHEDGQCQRCSHVVDGTENVLG